jgi:hypothetical protein
MPQTKKPYPADRAFGSAVLELFSGWNDAHCTTLFSALQSKLNGAVCQCEQGVILAAANAFTWVELSTALANDDVASQYVNYRQLFCVPCFSSLY